MVEDLVDCNNAFLLSNGVVIRLVFILVLPDMVNVFLLLLPSSSKSTNLFLFLMTSGDGSSSSAGLFSDGTTIWIANGDGTVQELQGEGDSWYADLHCF